ncbi:hypothetical protein [Actinokineospora bangkokensis]|uniref:SWIM-type domain-containing protein n=1 Tax=Actinokineospora bangkokensis TaxID=1193682 RepID=A0A1Q9LGT1_9PSEU|nr:hypothetical protein [Actinokineospora bangkokensis]OLR91226.1 hypothetical protein BJP25_26490 [Actinokineospora bangkokensis]
MTAVRADLLALTPDALVALANRGLVKRATKDIDAGTLPVVTTDADGTVRGEFPDGATAVLPAGAGLAAGTCSCAAPGVCRHRIGLVLAYQRTAAADPVEQAPAEPAAPWSPGAFTDEQLEAAFTARTLATARKTWRAGYPARVRRPAGTDPAVAELASCTVRFLVPGELGYVDTDATATTRDVHVVLAVWAFRAADERDPDAPEQRVDVGGAALREGSGLDAALTAVDDVLRSGAVNSGPVLAATLRRTADDLEPRNLRWPVAVLDDLSTQLTAYTDRSATYSAHRVATLVAELHARHRSVTAGGASLRSRVLGTEERATTPLRRIRLTALGCRITGTDTHRTAEVYLADPNSGTVLLLRRAWDTDDSTTGPDLAARRVVGTPLHKLATANVVSESATRSAGREIRITQGSLAKTAITPLGDAWTALPPSVLVTSYEALSEELASLPPWCVRPRVAAEFVRVLRVAEVGALSYSPGAQRLTAQVHDGVGGTALVSCDYRGVCPGALDALADQLVAGPTEISGTVSRVGGVITVDPVAVRAGGGVVVLDLAPSDRRADLGVVQAEAADPLVLALENALATLAEPAHRGLSHPSPSYGERVEAAARRLAGVGLRRCADVVSAFGGEGSVDAWVDAWVRLSTVAEFR